MAPSLGVNGFWFIFKDDQLLISIIGGDHQPIDAEISMQLAGSLIRQHLLTRIGGCDIYCAECQPDTILPESLQLLPLRSALEVLGPDWYTLAAKAYAIINWDKNHQFCGRCGHATEERADMFERICTACSLTFYPRISPSIIVLIHQDDHILMARGHHFAPGAYGLIAGFVEAGETIEDAVHREVQEEIGIHIKNLRYFSSQAWPFPDSLMIAFIAEYASGEININPAEIEDADWYSIDNLPKRTASSVSIARRLIDHFVDEYQQNSIK